MSNSPSRLSRLLGLIELDPGNVVLRLDAIREAFAVGEWDAARRLLDDGLLAYPGEPQLQGLSGFSHLQAERYNEAEQALRAALVHVKSAELGFNLACALFLQRRYADALEQLRDPLYFSEGPLGAVLRARCLHHLSRPEEAIVDLEKHLGSSPEDAEAHGLLALLLYEKGSSGTARGHVDAALQRDPRQIEALLALASLQSERRELDAARKSFSAILRVDPRCGRAWLGLALLDLRELRMDAAKSNVQIAASHMPEHIGTWHVLGWTYIMLGDIAGAQTAFERALSVDHNFGETHGGLAVIAALQNRPEETRLGIKRALRLDPQSLSAKYAEFLLLQRQGRHDDAKAVLDTVLSRSAGRGGLQYRDLVVAQLQALRARDGSEPPRVYH